MSDIHPLRFVREFVFGLNQSDFGALCGLRKAAVSKWETGIVACPPFETLRPILKAEAARRSLPWNDSWLFELPVCNACSGDGRCVAGCARVVAASAHVRAGDKAKGAALLAGCGDLHLSGPPVCVAGLPPSDPFGATSPALRGEELETRMNGALNGKATGVFPEVGVL